jgi:hypothetical protein
MTERALPSPLRAHIRDKVRRWQAEWFQALPGMLRKLNALAKKRHLPNLNLAMPGFRHARTSIEYAG